MPKISSYGGITPELVDLLYIVDAGTTSESTTITALRDLLQANLTTAVASVGYNISTDVKLVRDAAAFLALRDGTIKQGFSVYGTWTDSSNYERGVIHMGSGALTFGTHKAGTGSAKNISFTYGGAEKMNITNDRVEFKISPSPNLTTGVLTLGNTVRPWGDVISLGHYVTKDAGELTISSGSITVTGGFHTVDTEADAGSDPLTAIVGGIDGAMLTLMAEDTARDVVVTASSTIKLAGGAIMTLASTEDTITFIYSGALSAWVETSRSVNA